MSAKRIVTALFSGLLLIIFGISTAYAEVQLPDGAVKGLPEKLTAMDSSGNAVNSATGEYFFHVENMVYGEVYTKDIQLMNLLDDEAYHIYFYVEPKPESKKGDIDLEKGCVCTFYLDGKQFYSGDINGVGNIDLQNEAKDLGFYEPGDSHQLSCSIAWVKETNDYAIDEGHRIVDINGTTVERPRTGQDHIDGEIEFKWIFYAAKEENYTPPNTGLLGASDSFWLVCIAVLLILTAAMFLLVAVKKKKEKKAK